MKLELNFNMTVLEYLRAATNPATAQQIANAVRYNVEFVEKVLDELNQAGKVAQLNSGRWEAAMAMPTGKPKDERRAAQPPKPRLPRAR